MTTKTKYRLHIYGGHFKHTRKQFANEFAQAVYPIHRQRNSDLHLNCTIQMYKCYLQLKNLHQRNA